MVVSATVVGEGSTGVPGLGQIINSISTPAKTSAARVLDQTPSGGGVSVVIGAILVAGLR